MILYRKFQNSGKLDKEGGYFWDPKQSTAKRVFTDIDAARQFFAGRYKTRTNKGTYRCTGSAMDACNYDWRANLDATGLPTLPGDDPKSLDAWDIKRTVRNSPAAGTVIYDRSSNKPLSETDLKNLPLGSLLGYKDARGHYGIGDYKERLSRHTISIVGFLEDGTPLSYSLGRVTPVDKHALKDLNYIAVPNKKGFNFKGVLAARDKYAKTAGSAPTKSIDEYINGIDKNLSGNFKTQIKRFTQTIDDNKDMLMNKLNLSPKGFSHFKNLAIALATQEGGTMSWMGLAGDAILGDTEGLTQLNSNYIDFIDKNYGIKKIFDNYFQKQRVHNYTPPPKTADLMDPRASALYTMALLADNAHRYKRSKTNYTEPSTIREFDRSSVPESIAPYAAKIAGKLPDWLVPDSMYKTRPTAGTNPNLSDVEVAAYLWNNPSRITRGDAQGAKNNKYVSNVLNYYNALTAK